LALLGRLASASADLCEAGGGAQGEALAQRPGERRIAANNLIQQGETGAGAESRVATPLHAGGSRFRRPRPRWKRLFQQRVGRRETWSRKPARSPPGRGDKRLAARIGGGNFVIEDVGGIESDHGFSITQGGALSRESAPDPPRPSPSVHVR
jgi:hypothetical protein